MPIPKYIYQLCFATALLIGSTKAHSQIPGCTDSLSNNFNPAATVNNGSCTYNTTSYTPPLKVDPISDTLVETSGLTMAGNYLWSHNDGGGSTAIYRIDTLTNALLQRVYLAGAVNVDWEDMAFDGTNFYIGDFGNNANGARTDLKIYKFPLRAIPGHTTNPVTTIEAGLIETIHFTYSNQPQPPQPVAANSTAFDCEAMIVDSGRIHLFTKNWVGLNTVHYIINGIATGSYTAMPQDTLPTNYLVTAAAKAPGRNVVVLLGYQNTGTANHFMHLLTQYSGGNFFNGNKRKLNLPSVLSMGQAEGITFRNSGYGYISNEKFVGGISPFIITVRQRLRSFNIANYIPNVPGSYVFTGSGNWNIAANWNFYLMPPANVFAGSQIIIDPPMDGSCILNVPFTVKPGVILQVRPGKSFIVHQNLTLQR